MPLYKAWDTRRRKRRTVAAIVIFVILNQTKFRTREGAFDISVFPLGKAFDIKIGKYVKSPWVCQNPPRRA